MSNFVGKCQIVDEIKHRFPYYSKDWKDAARYARVLVAPTIYVFLNSLIPALAFREQISNATKGAFGIPHVLAATAVSGVIQALLGGQPLLILGLAEPIVVMYGFMHTISENNPDIGHDLFRPWCAWVAVWVGAFCTLYAALGVTRLIRYFTRFFGHSFGCLIIILFIQQAIVGTVNEFTEYGATNGMWGLVVVLNLPLTALALTQFRNTQWLTQTIRNILSDYAAFIAVLLWTALSAALAGSGLHVLPHHVDSIQPWNDPNWGVGINEGMADLPVSARLLAAGPGLTISILFFFDHTVSSQLAQTGDDIVVNRPPTYAYDLLLLGVITSGFGLLGLPMVNGVIPQAPLHSRALKGLKQRADACGGTPIDDIHRRESEEEDVALSIHDVRPPPVRVHLVDEHVETYQINQQKMTVLEQRGSNLMQALLCGCLVPAAPVTRLLPTSVLWGYFAYMALDAARADNDLIYRISLLFRGRQHVTPREGETVDEAQTTVLDTNNGNNNSAMWNTRYAHVPLSIVYLYTFIQAAMVLGIWLLIYFGAIVEWGGILFPIFLVALLAIRVFVLPMIFSEEHLEALDPYNPAPEDNAANSQPQPQPPPSLSPSPSQPSSGGDNEGKQQAPQEPGPVPLPLSQAPTPVDPAPKEKGTVVRRIVEV